MKIVVASNRGTVSQHFGHSEGFEVFEVQGNTAGPSRFILSPGHGKGSLPGLLIEEGAQVLLAGGLGEGAMARLTEGGVAVVTGVSGSTEEAVRMYLSGELVSGESLCKGHGHEHNHDHNHEHKHDCQGEGGCGKNS